MRKDRSLWSRNNRRGARGAGAPGLPPSPSTPIAIATAAGIAGCRPRPAANGGVSGMLLRVGDLFCIAAYATHISSPGFRSVSALRMSSGITFSAPAMLMLCSRITGCTSPVPGS